MVIHGSAGPRGDALAYYFQQQKIGPLIDTRTWGALIGTLNIPATIDADLIELTQRRKGPRMRRILTLAVAIVALQVVVPSGQPAAPALTSIEVMIPMRDGTKLFTQIYTPRLREGFGAAGSQMSRCRSSSSGRPTAWAATPRRWWRRRWSIFPRPATSS